MNIRKLYLRTVNLLSKPISEFNSISIDNQSIKDVNKSVVIPFSALVAICAFLGSLFTHISSPLDSIVYVFLNAVIVFLIVLTESYLAGKLIAILGRNINISNKKESVYALVVYSQIPFYLILAFIKVFPSLIFLIFLGVYTGYLMYVGIDALLKISSVRKMQFMVLSLIIMTTLFIAISELFSVLYSEIIDLFTTFALL
jgi:hypothetical protein